MGRPLLVVTDLDRYPLTPAEEEALAALGAQVRGTAFGDDEATVLAACRDADVVWVWATPISRRVVEGLRRCRLLAFAGSGYDRIDTEAAAERGIPVSYNPDFCVEDVSDLAIGLILAAERRIALLDRAVRAGRWLRIDELGPMHRLSTRRVGILGLGRIGLAVARKLRGWDMPLYGWGRSPGGTAAAELGIVELALDELVEVADVLTVHVPLTRATAGLLGWDRLSRMPPGSTLVNTSRGGIVDEPALVRALREGPLAGAGLDVFAAEPLPAGSPLRTLEQVVLSSHTAAWTAEALAQQRRDVLDEIGRALRGAEPLRPVPGGRGEP